MTGISTHILDTAKGLPARGVPVLLERQSPEGAWNFAGEGITDDNGRIARVLPEGASLEPGVYRLIFRTSVYFEGQESFYPEVTVAFLVRDPYSHHHVPLLLSPYGYSTYRGS